MPGLFVPDNYKPDLPNQIDMIVASVAWGFSLGTIIFNCTKALQQTISTFRRKKRFTFYITLIWLEICSSLSLSIICWMYLRLYIQPSMQFFFFIIVTWSTQVQCLIQIIINRVGLLLVVREHATRLKWGCFFTLLTINISVFCIWIPARLQINETYIRVNDIWDRREKVIFGLMDATLNIIFIVTVKRRLIENGLRKYTALYHANLILVVFSIGLDILLISMMSLPNSFVYIQFHPLMYLLKLHIEMNMAELIGKVVRASNPLNEYGDTTEPTIMQSRIDDHNTFDNTGYTSQVEPINEEEIGTEKCQNIQGIMKTMETKITRSSEKDYDDELAGASSQC